MRIHGCWIQVLLCMICLALDVGAIELRMGLPLPFESKEWTIAAKGAERMSQAPTGEVSVVLVPSEKDGPSIAAQLQRGELEGGLVIMQDFGTLSLGQDAFTYALPCTFMSTNEVFHIREKLDATLLQKLSEGPYEAVAIVGFGAAYAMSTQALSTPADWRERKIWIPSGDAFIQNFNMLNLQTVSTSVKDVRARLKSGLLDTIIVPPTVAVMKRWHTRVRNVFDAPFVYTYGIWVLRDDVLERLSEADQKGVLKHLSVLCQELDDAIQGRNTKAREVLNRYGVAFLAPNAAMKEQWSHWADALWLGLEASQKPSLALHNALKEHLENNR